MKNIEKNFKLTYSNRYNTLIYQEGESFTCDEAHVVEEDVVAEIFNDEG